MAWVVAYGVSMGSQDGHQHACILRHMHKTVAHIGHVNAYLSLLHTETCVTNRARVAPLVPAVAGSREEEVRRLPSGPERLFEDHARPGPPEMLQQGHSSRQGGPDTGRATASASVAPRARALRSCATRGQHTQCWAPATDLLLSYMTKS